MVFTNTSTDLHEEEKFLSQHQLVLVITTLDNILFVTNLDHNDLSTLLPTIGEDL